MIKILIVSIALTFFSGLAHSLEKLAPGQPLPHDLFVNLAKKLNPAVVNISTAQKINQRRQSYSQDPFFDLFEMFMNQGRGGGSFNAPPRRRGGGLGTGFIISADGLIITNNHVIDGADIINVQLSGSKKNYEARVIGKDKKTDIALIKIKADFKLPTATLGNSSKLEVGEWVAAFGNPFGHTHSMSKGTVSAIGRKIDELNQFSFIQTDASINPGNSGGPLVNTSGEVIGVNTAIDGRAQGIGFAIPIDDVKRVVTHLEQYGGVKRAYMGIRPEDVRTRDAYSLGLPNNQGALVLKVYPRSPASKAGLQDYDFITHINNKKIKSSRELIYLIGSYTAGKEVKVKLIRNKKKKNIKVTLGLHPESQNFQKSNTTKQSSYEGQKAPYDLGFYFNDYNRKLMQRFNLAQLEKRRPVIINVKPGTPASDAGLYPGDIILDVNKTAVYKSKDVFRKLKKDRINVLKILRRNEVALVYVSSKS